MFDELGIGDLLDELLPQDPYQRKVSVGRALKAMVLNGLGFANRRLYLVPEFFRNKPTERLVGEGISPEHLNDDALGKAFWTRFTPSGSPSSTARSPGGPPGGSASGAGWPWHTWTPPASTWMAATTAKDATIPTKTPGGSSA